jgi:hypothetical protein
MTAVGPSIQDVSVASRQRGSGRQDLYARLKGIVLLCGAVRPTPLSEGIGRSLLDLPLDAGQTLLDRWVGQAQELAAAHGIGRLPLMVMLDASSLAPAIHTTPESGQMVGAGRVPVSVMRDPFEYRGTGGVLFDIAKDLDDADYLLVATGAQLLVEPLKELVRGLEDKGGDVSVLGHRDGTPTGLMLIRCGALRGIAPLGFVDLKEQALPAIAKKFQVTVEHRETVSYPVRTTADYVTALRHYHRRVRGELAPQGPFAEDWRAEFSVVEEGAVIETGARLFDSVVLKGGRVGAGAVLVRSVVCPEGTVRGGSRGVDQLFAADGRVGQNGAWIR